MKNILFYVFIFATSLLSSCTTDNSNAKKDLLTAHPWREVSDRVDGVEQHNSAPCSADDMYIFRSDYGFAFDEGATRCQVTSPQSIELGTWAFNTDESRVLLYLTGFATPSDGYLTTLTENTLVITFTIVHANGTTSTEVTTYEKY